MSESTRHAVPEAQLEDSGSGLAPATEGWFVVNVRDAEWLTSETSEADKITSGSECAFETRKAEFPQLGIRIHVLQPGERKALYNRKSGREAFSGLLGECRLPAEGRGGSL